MNRFREFVRRVGKYLKACFLVPVHAVRIVQVLDDLQRQFTALSALVGYLPEVCNAHWHARRRKTAIMTVLIVKENILFLDEWISHHLAMGVDQIVLYDNSKTQCWDTFEHPPDGVLFEGNRVNKHNVDYDQIVSARLSPEEVEQRFQQLRERYSDRLTVLEWAKRDKSGRVCYFQADAIKDFIFRFRLAYDYGIAIDTDEFLVSDEGLSVPDLIDHMERNNVGSGHLSQRRFLYRFASMDTQVREIPYCLKQDLQRPDTTACKCIFRMHLYQHFHEPLGVHYIPSVLAETDIDPGKMRIHHYGWPSVRGKHSLKDLDEAEKRFVDERFAVDRSAFRYLGESCGDRGTGAGATSVADSPEASGLR